MDGKFFSRGKIQDLRKVAAKGTCVSVYTATDPSRGQELQEADHKDKKYAKRKIVLKKIVANITMGNDS